MKKLIRKLAGSVKVPPKFKDIDVDNLIERAKVEHFSKKIR